MQRSSSTLLAVAFATGCGGAVAINSGSPDAAHGPTVDMTTPSTLDAANVADMALDTSGYPLTGTYEQPVPPSFGCQLSQWTDFKAPTTFQVVSTATKVEIVYMGTVEESWTVGNDGTQTGTYSKGNTVFAIRKNTRSFDDYVLSRTSSGLHSTIPNVGTDDDCDWTAE